MLGVFCLVLLLVSVNCSRLSSYGDESNVQAIYEQWLKQHGKVYHGAGEKEERFAVFQDNYNYISVRNAEIGESYHLGLTKFADLTNEEFRAKHVGKRIATKKNGTSSSNGIYEVVDVDSLPTTVDWRKYGIVTAVKDQGQCGACWAFSAVVATEGLHALVNKQLVSLSEQQLIDCDTKNDQGCNGGLMDDAFEYIIQNGGLTTEANYPYKAQDGSCNRNKEKSRAVSIDGFEDVPSQSEDSLLKAVSIAPVSVAIEAGGRDFQLYSKGIFTGKCGTELDHGVAAVGYGTSTSGKKYWIVKNSWGTGWGESGYIRMERIGNGDGLCGINIEASYPTKSRKQTNNYM